MEIIVELLFVVFQFVGEVVLQVFLEALAELGIHSVREPFRRRKSMHPVMAGIGYAIPARQIERFSSR